MLSNYKSHPGSVLAGTGGGGGITTDFDSVSQLSQKAYSNTMAIPKTTSGAAGSNNMALGDLTNFETSDTSVIDYNLVNEEMKYRANLDNMYKKGRFKHLYILFSPNFFVKRCTPKQVNANFFCRSLHNDHSHGGLFNRWR